MCDQRPVNRRRIEQYRLSEPAIYEVRGTGVKLIGSNRMLCLGMIYSENRIPLFGIML